MAKRRRPNTATAPAPKSSSIGGAGTCVPLVVLVLLDPLVEPEVLVLEEVEELVELLVEDEVELDEVLLLILPELVLVELLPEDEPEELDEPELEPLEPPQCLWQG
ncbi:hypothetical protein [Altererythrobacter fulvus]|uniref:hypothetical protein n=1 Tax=Caenibius fulvus TaxID=2126012 RepID=UPI00301715FC